MATVVLTIHLLLALGLIVVVLLQRSEGGGLGIGGGGGGNAMSSRSGTTALSKVTWGLGVAFVATSLTLTVIAARESATDSVLDRIRLDPGMAPSPEAPLAPPAPGDELLPPLPTAPQPPDDSSPLTPPPLD